MTFKVGDRVRVLYAGPLPHLVGHVGTVIELVAWGEYDYLVHIDGLPPEQVFGVTMAPRYNFRGQELTLEKHDG